MWLQALNGTVCYDARTKDWRRTAGVRDKAFGDTACVSAGTDLELVSASLGKGWSIPSAYGNEPADTHKAVQER